MATINLPQVPFTLEGIIIFLLNRPIPNDYKNNELLKIWISN
ncbi:hypothetical protein [Spiroplasma endosymbiont of Megaselia nigra]|nr:hypothetical protein [Spiroplasma endosymbiont of Megaselia nigra]